MGSLDGPVVRWRRDLSDPYKFHVNVPENVHLLAISHDSLEVPSHANTTGTDRWSSHVVMLEPSEVVMYRSDQSLHSKPIVETIHLPASWRAATALRTSGSTASLLNGPDTTYEPVSIEQLIDSPILAGDHCRQCPLAPEIRPVHTLDVCTDSEDELKLQPDFLAKLTAMYHSLGFQAMPDGTLQDVWVGCPAYVAGLGPGDKLTAVNGKPYTAELLTAAVHDLKTYTRPIVFDCGAG